MFLSHLLIWQVLITAAKYILVLKNYLKWIANNFMVSKKTFLQWFCLQKFKIQKFFKEQIP